MSEAHILINGTAIEVKPIFADEVDRVVLRCWPDREAIGRILAYQDILGFAAWEGERCVAQLHCYRVETHQSGAPLWPYWNNWWDNKADAALVPCMLPRRKNTGEHEGRVEDACSRRIVPEVGNDFQKVSKKLRELCVPNFDESDLLRLLNELPAKPFTPVFQGGLDRRYQGKGIGTALCKASIAWAQSNGYSFVLALGGTPNDHSKAEATGQLSAHTYEKLGFVEFGLTHDGREGYEGAVMAKKLERA
jgi:GNAT superfamily N-acetyltransferase